MSAHFLSVILVFTSEGDGNGCKATAPLFLIMAALGTYRENICQQQT
jgi:hypothetical protein